MFNRLFFILFSLILLVSLTAIYYHAESAKKDNAIKALLHERDNAWMAMEGMKKQHQQLAVLDSQHTQELDDANRQIAALERAVHTGQRRLQLAATCPKTVPHTAASARLDDVAGARLDDTAVHAYFRLRNDIEIVTQQIKGLQDYITQICLVQ
ncbi:Bacteriophage lysis protein [Candidatus Regiella insecticola 5.15]|uniref:Bacteriophage lysis protein n=1 Tax=Candidatus Regiella insecticola 5.15 TaxID=1005043 RepID=G2GWT1_9ENTR|nr:lysis protein [Candidatus Regiella insecticola]EGY29800.1 Bacteriophage lysis protein [Candidatus Regiella insecticola 5.15]